MCVKTELSGESYKQMTLFLSSTNSQHWRDRQINQALIVIT